MFMVGDVHTWCLMYVHGGRCTYLVFDVCSWWEMYKVGCHVLAEAIVIVVSCTILMGGYFSV
jgi:hypothetical protein